MSAEEKKEDIDIQAEAKKEVLKKLEEDGVISYMRAKIKKSVIDILDKQSEDTKQKLEFDFMTPLHRLNKSKEVILAGHLIKQFLEFYKLEYTLPIFENESNIHEKIKKESLASEFNIKDSKEKDIPILVQLILEYQSMKKKLETYQSSGGFTNSTYSRLLGNTGFQNKTAEDRFSNPADINTFVPNKRLAPINMTNNSVEINHNDEEVDSSKFSTFNINPALMRPKSENKEITANDILNKDKKDDKKDIKKDIVIGDDDKIKNSSEFKKDEIGGNNNKDNDDEFVEEKLEYGQSNPKEGDKDESHDSFKASGGFDVSASKTGNEFDYTESAELPKSI